MATDTEMPAISFSGSKSVQEAAEKALNAMRAQGMFMADNAPIRVRKDQLVAFLEESGGVKAADVDKAITENSEVFAVETDDQGIEFVITTRGGKAPVADREDLAHTLGERLMTPQPKPEKPAMPVRERVQANPSWATYTVPDYIDEEEQLDIQDALAAADEVETAEPVAAEVETETAPVETEEPVVEATPVSEEAPVVEEPVAEAPTGEPAAAVEPTDLSGQDDTAVAAALDQALGSDPRVARFGDKWMAEDKVHRLSRGELRRLKDYLEEQEQPLTDETLVQDILGVRQTSADYENALFSLNYRLSRERDFEFVGTNGQRFWSTPTLPPIGTDRRKHNDIGTDYRYLVEDVPADIEHRSVQSVDHVVTFYEHTLGVLPYDEDLQKLLPAPVDPDQRTAVFTFEIPQTYTTYLVELRYPTPNRGGFLLGLDDFYAESIVPGAIISISATENDGHYTVEYLAAADKEDRLLELDDRRTPRYHFRPTTYGCEVDDAWLINEDRFPTLGSEKPLADKIRRRTEDVIKATFERIGMDDGEGGKLASFEDLLAAVNIERPFSEASLRAAMESDTNISGDDANGYTYATGS